MQLQHLPSLRTRHTDGIKHEEDHLRGADDEGPDELEEDGEGEEEAPGRRRVPSTDERRHDAEPRLVAGAPAAQAKGEVGRSAERTGIAGVRRRGQGHVPGARGAGGAAAWV